MTGLGLLTLLAGLWSGAAVAADVPTLGRSGGVFGVFSEIRVGAMAHDPASPERGSGDLAFQVLLNRPFATQGGWAALVPRPLIGGSVNLAGRTSHLHAGLNWTLDLGASFFVEGGLGVALHDGPTGRRVPADRNALGCSAQLRESAGIGYRFDARWSVIASVEHLSNAGLCRRNRGLTNLGVMVGYRF
jgi:lipid A 3-O-deacylase